MTLKIKPVRLNKSIYVRVPNDIADLVGMDQLAELTFNLEDKGEEFTLTYSGKKPSSKQTADSYESYSNPQVPLAKS